MYYCISQDGGRTWNGQSLAYLDEKIRDPELARLDGKYYLHGRSGHSREGGHRFVLYQSDDGVHWKNGAIVSGDTRGPDGYSHNCIINKYDRNATRELMVLYSIVYSPPRTSEYVFFVKPENDRQGRARASWCSPGHPVAGVAWSVGTPQRRERRRGGSTPMAGAPRPRW